MPRFYFCSLLCSIAIIATAAPAPLTANEIGLMLRTGYSSASVLQELSKRKFADTLDATKETQLIKAGASADLLMALKNGSYTISPQELAQAQQQKEIEAKRRAAAAEEAQKFNTLRQAQLAQEHAANAMRQKLNQEMFYQLVKGDLVQGRNGSVVHFDDTALENKKLFLI